MKLDFKYILIIVLMLITAAATYFAVSSHYQNKEAEQKIEKISNEVKDLKKYADSVQVITDDLKDSVIVRDVEIEKLQKSQEKSRKEAADYRKKYIELKNLNPVTVDDSLDVSEGMVEVLLGENKAQAETIVKLDSVVAIQAKTITDLKQIVVNLEDVIDVKDKIIELKDKQIELKNKQLKKQKGKKLGAYLTGGAIGAILAVLAVL